MLSRLFLALSVCVALSGTAGARIQAPADAGRIPVLAELFTSEGCSSCPPADQILEMLGTEQPVDGVYVVGLSEHVTYWDHQGWRDPFASPSLTNRQYAYGAHFNLESVFTPQVVVDGTRQMVGSDTNALKRALAEVARAPKPLMTLTITPADKGLAVTASGPGIAAGAADGAELLWAVTEDHIVVDVKRGENAKRTLKHSGVVRTLVAKKIDGAKPGFNTSAVLSLQPDWQRDNLRVVAFVQSTRSRRVISVASARLPGAPAAP